MKCIHPVDMLDQCPQHIRVCVSGTIDYTSGCEGQRSVNNLYLFDTMDDCIGFLNTSNDPVKEEKDNDSDNSDDLDNSSYLSMIFRYIFISAFDGTLGTDHVSPHIKEISIISSSDLIIECATNCSKLYGDEELTFKIFGRNAHEINTLHQLITDTATRHTGNKIDDQAISEYMDVDRDDDIEPYSQYPPTRGFEISTANSHRIIGCDAFMDTLIGDLSVDQIGLLIRGSRSHSYQPSSNQDVDTFYYLDTLDDLLELLGSSDHDHDDFDFNFLMYNEIQNNKEVCEIISHTTTLYDVYVDLHCMSFELHAPYDGYEENYRIDIVTKSETVMQCIEGKIGRWIK
jgi:hypothetical protein